MELHKFHVAQLRPGSECHGMTVAGRDGWIRGFTVNPPGSSGTQDCLPGPHQDHSVPRMIDDRSPTRSLTRQQVDRERVLPKRHVLLLPRSLNDRPHHFASGRIAQSVHDAMMAVPPFPSQFQVAVLAIEPSPPRHEFLDATRCFPHHHFHDVAVAQPHACPQRVLLVILKPILRIEHSGNPSLSVMTARLVRRFLRHDQDLERVVDRIGCSQPRQASADHQDIGKEMRPFRQAKRHEVTGYGIPHG